VRYKRAYTVENLGTDFELPEKRWKELTDCIEGIVIGSEPLLPFSEEIEKLARIYARKLVFIDCTLFTEGLSHIAHHPYETQEARNQFKLGNGEKGAFHSCAYLHHSKKRRWEDHPHPQIFQARTLPHPHLRWPKTPPSARQNHQDDPLKNINMAQMQGLPLASD